VPSLDTPVAAYWWTSPRASVRLAGVTAIAIGRGGPASTRRSQPAAICVESRGEWC
jgi:hypothetical protein